MSDSPPHTTFVAPEISRLAPLFPGYEIDSLIATGGMGAVYRAVQKSLDRIVAIKVLPDEFSKDASFCAGFEAEAKAMARLNHPNLIGVFDFGEVDGMLFIIMEYVPGKSLFHSAHGISIDPTEVIRLVTGICNGLAHAHENGIIHRDIKPSNILLELDAQPKIGDFGLARPVEHKDQEGEEIFGTPHYTAPEVVNSPQSVGFRADIFSVGVLLHELLTGRLPADDPRPASAISGCDPRFDTIIRRATNPNPNLRYASAAEIANDLQAIAHSPSNRMLRTAAPALHAVPRPGAHLTRPLPVQSSSSAGIVWVLILVAAGIVGWALLKDDGDAPLPPTEDKTLELPKEVPTLPMPDPEPITAPTPVPEPVQVPMHEPEPAPKPEPAPEPESAPTPKPALVVPIAPVFDVQGFYDRAHKVMEERTAPLVAERDKDIKKNLSAMERAFKRMIRKLPDAKEQKQSSRQLERLIQQCERAGNRIPKELDKKLSEVSEVKDIYEEYLDKQKAIDAKMVDEVTKLSTTYLTGLQKQVERLVADKDDVAAKLIDLEINKVSQDVRYFPSLMLGEDDPAIAKPKAPKDEKGKNP